jgi:RNA polymerase sigma-70 factor (ECF subfamily)
MPNDWAGVLVFWNQQGRSLMSQPSDKSEAQRAAERWFEAEVRPHEGALKSWLRARFPNLGDVDDIAQEATVRVWRRQTRADAEPLKSPKATLFAVARNAVLDLLRRKAVAKTAAVAEMGELSVLDESVDVVRTVVARQELELLTEAVRTLPDRCRQVVTLTKVYGLTEREVAERLGVSENTVRTQVVRGMDRCAAYLRERGAVRGSPGAMHKRDVGPRRPKQ